VRAKRLPAAGRIPAVYKYWNCFIINYLQYNKQMKKLLLIPAFLLILLFNHCNKDQTYVLKGTIYLQNNCNEEPTTERSIKMTAKLIGDGWNEKDNEMISLYPTGSTNNTLQGTYRYSVVWKDNFEPKIWDKFLITTDPCNNDYTCSTNSCEFSWDAKRIDVTGVTTTNNDITIICSCGDPAFSEYSIQGNIDFINQCSEEIINDEIIIHAEIANGYYGEVILDTLVFNTGNSLYEIETTWLEIYQDPTNWRIWFSDLSGNPVCNYECDGSCYNTSPEENIEINSHQMNNDIEINCECGEPVTDYIISGVVNYKNRCIAGELNPNMIINTAITNDFNNVTALDTVNFSVLSDSTMSYTYTTTLNWPYDTPPTSGSIWFQSADPDFESICNYGCVDEAEYCAANFDNGFVINDGSNNITKNVDLICECFY